MEFRAPEGDLAGLLDTPGPVLEAAVAALASDASGRRILCRNAIDIALSWKVRGSLAPGAVTAAIGSAVDDAFGGQATYPYAGILTRLGVDARACSPADPARAAIPLWLHGRARAAGMSLPAPGEVAAIAQIACTDLFLCEFIEAARALAVIGAQGASLDPHIATFVDDAHRYLRGLAGDLRSPTLSWELAILDAAAP